MKSMVSGRVAACLAMVAVAQACSDSTGPSDGGGGSVASVSISREPSAPLEVGDTLTLGASTNNAQGAPVNATVSWSTTNPAVATVTGSGQVRAVAPGEAKIVASAGQAADTATITVQAGTSGCSSSGVQMAVGEVRQIDPRRDPGVCLPASTGGYTLVAFSGGDPASDLNLTVEAVSAAPLVAGAALAGGLFPRRDPALPLAGPRRDFGLEDELRRAERAQLGGRFGGMVSRRAAAAFARADVPAVGDTMHLNSRSDFNQLCAAPVTRIGRVAAVTAKAIVVHDPTNPAGGFTDAEYREIGLLFDTLVFRVDSAHFGVPGDIDDNGGRIVIFYTRAVNELSDPGSGEFTGGYFSNRDFSTRGQCAGSNEREIFYVLTPDPDGVVENNPFTKDFVRGVTIATLAHELKHLTGASRRLFVLQTGIPFDESWLEEGVAHIAEELVFYRASGLQPKQNLGLDDIREPDRVLDAFIDYASSNLGSFQQHVKNPERNSPYDNDPGGVDIATRGAAWAFLRYAADRAGVPETELWNKLVNTSLRGFANLRNALGGEPVPLVRDWSVSVYTDDLVNTSAIYQQPSWNLRELIDRGFQSSGGYALPLRALGATPINLSLVGGGASYLTVNTTTASRTNVRITSGGVAPPATLSVFVVRTR